MIVGVGIHMLALDTKVDENNAREYLTNLERQGLAQVKDRDHFFLKKIVAKMAFLKAFRQSIKREYQDNMMFSQVEVAHDKLGCPEFKFGDELQRLLSDCIVLLTLSDESNYVVGCVIIDKMLNEGDMV